MSELQHAVGYLDDVLGDIDDDFEGPKFREGVAFARYQVRFLQLRDRADCCDQPFPEKLGDDSWECETCETTLIDNDPTPEP